MDEALAGFCKNIHVTLNADGSILAYLGDGQQINEGAGYLWFCTNEGFGSNWCKYVEKIIINDAD